MSLNCIQGSESRSASPIIVTHNRRQIRLSSTRNDNVNTNVSIESQHYSDNSAVFIRNLCKKYGNGPPVLKNLCMNVRKGTIYGLLGASGCGKSTILSCIVGLNKWDSGEVLVYGNCPGTDESEIPGKKLGYMPQDHALYPQLSIREMIEFYGRLYNMTSAEVKEKWVFLARMLQLPSNFRLIGDLSGGQKRRASLCITLMHSPPLVVLDEPTVGLDPLLRRSIWNHLYKIVSTLHTTIIITTHYIEEARLSNTIGFVRKGRLLVEDTPANLLTSFKCDLLEDVVLNLCRRDEDGIKNLSNNSSSMYSEGNKVKFSSKWKDQTSSSIVASHQEQMDGIFRKTVGFDCDLSQNLRRKEEDTSNGSIIKRLTHHPVYESLQRIRGLTTVILLTFIRHPIFIAIILLLPTIHGTLTLVTVGTKPTGFGIAVVNNELANWTSECELQKHLGNSCDFSALSCKLLNQIKEDNLFKLINAPTEDDAKELVHLGQSWGYITFPSNFSQHTVDLVAAKYYAFNESIVGSRIHAYLDFSQYLSVYFMIKKLFSAYEEYVVQLAESCQIGGKETESPLNFREPVYGTYEDEFTEFLMPGVILTCLLGVLGVLTSVIFISDRKLGTLSRARVAGLATVDVMMSHMITQGLVALSQIILWTMILHFCFGFHVMGSTWLYILICLLSGFCGASLGILLGILCEDEVEALIFGVFWCPILLLFGGVFSPVEAMPVFWQNFGTLLPTTLPIRALRAVIVRGSGLSHNLVYPGVLVLLGWIVIFSILVLFCYKKYAK